MFCPHCGRAVPEATFCTECGKRLDGSGGQTSRPNDPFASNPYSDPNANRIPYAPSTSGFDEGPVRHISFREAVVSYFGNYSVFHGRATRSEYWYVFLFNCIVSIVLNGPGMFSSSAVATLLSGLSILYAVGTILPSLGLSWRRLHDIGKSGFWYLLVLIPLVGAIILLAFYCTDSKPDNQYGPKKTEANRGTC